MDNKLIYEGVEYDLVLIDSYKFILNQEEPYPIQLIEEGEPKEGYNTYSYEAIPINGKRYGIIKRIDRNEL